ncbi:MAG: hypothetical protein F9K38_07680 [Pseudorhodoplanes sp.]|nr:MAG: hypothetical protein F9K38_07680 [Pseudorhodoplanes sp.]
MSAEVRKLAKAAEIKLKELQRCAPVPIAELKSFPSSGGVYVISKGSQNLYAGLAKNLKRRLRQHINGKQIQSAFTLKLAAHDFRKTIEKVPSKSKLRSHKAFKKLYADTASRIRLMNARYVEVENAKLRIVLEVFAGVTFNTRWNDFNGRGTL